MPFDARTLRKAWYASREVTGEGEKSDALKLRVLPVSMNRRPVATLMVRTSSSSSTSVKFKETERPLGGG